MTAPRSFSDIIPGDRYDDETVANVHPPGWVNPRPARRYNLVVLGAGTAGEVAAGIAGSLGARVALVEKNLMGGDCLVTGCIPSKSIIRSAQAMAGLRRVGQFGVSLKSLPEIDFAVVMERMRQIRARLSRGDSAVRFRDEFGVDVLLGEGRFIGPETLDVGGQHLNFRKAIIATGSRPQTPPIPGLEDAGYRTSDTIFEIQELPPRLAVLGAGPIGCELAQAFSRLGAEVYLLDRARQIMPLEAESAAMFVHRALRRDGVTMILGASITRIEMSDGAKAVLFSRGDGEEAIAVDEILVATGRAPNVAGIGCEAAGVSYDKQTGIRVDDFLRTTNENIFGVGDCCMSEKFTHAADASSIAAVQNALLYGRQRKSLLNIPRCTYTDPEIAHIGLGPNEISSRGLRTRTFSISLADVDRAVIDGEEDGMVQVIASPRGRILGATIVARRAGDLISEISALMRGNIGLKDLSRVIHPFPTQSEAIRMVGDEFQKTRLNPVLRLLSALYFRTRLRV